MAYLDAAGIRTVDDLVSRAGRGLDREFTRHPEDLDEVYSRLSAAGL